MRNFIYACRQVFRLRRANFIKLLSLTLGIAISGTLMCRVAWEQSYDNFWNDADNLHYVEISYQNKEAKENGTTNFQKQLLAPMAPEMLDKIPSITAITRFSFPFTETFRVGSSDRLVDLNIWGVDSLFLDVFDLEIVEGGDAHKILATPSDILISKSTADKFFDGVSVIGQQLRIKERVFTVEGVFEDLPRNSYLHTMGNMDVLRKGRFRIDWDGGDNSFTYFRTKPGTDIAALETQIANVLNPRIESWKESGLELLYRTHNVRYAFYEQTKSIDLIMSLLSFALILIAGLNFALLSITSLACRAKEVGVHKASGANSRGIFALIIWETVIYSVLALGLAALLMFSFQSQLETIMGRFDDVFALANLWAVGVVLLIVIAVSGVIPAVIFARIPVTQVFQRFTATKARWKQVLLFIQFTSSIFVICFTFIIIKQYNALSAKDLGYKYDNLVTVKLTGAKGDVRGTLESELRLRSNVVDLCYTSDFPFEGLNGMMVSIESASDDHFSSRVIEVDSSFFNVYGIALDGTAELSTFRETGIFNVVANRELMRMLEMRGAGNSRECFIGGPATIKGVTPDFQVGNGLYSNRQPLVILAMDSSYYNACLTIRLNRVDRAAIEELQPIVNELYPDTKPEIAIYSQQIKEQYADNRMFRDGVILASLFLMIITIMGIMGYIGTETRRRAKEIAVRKIFGSSAIAVVIMLCRNITIIALVASAFAIPLAYIMGGYWQQQFAVKVPLTPDLFIYAAAIVLLVIIACVTMQTLRIATSNPAKSLKLE